MLDLSAMGTQPAIGFVTRHMPSGGYYWTLTTLLGRLLYEAEQAYGDRDSSWTLLGIEFAGEHPQVWFPGGGSRRHISIMLSEAASLDINLAIFELAHEVIHVLSPSGDRNVPCIEEGLATLNSHDVGGRCQIGFQTPPSAYLEAEKDVVSLLAIDPNAVKKLRSRNLSFEGFTPDLIQEVVPGVSSDLAVALCTPFREAEEAWAAKYRL